MKDTTLYTNSKIGDGYDIVEIDTKMKKYTLYLNYKDSCINVRGEVAKFISRKKFDRLLSSFIENEVFDLSGYDPDRYERFYRSCPFSEFDVDTIVIDFANKEFTVEYCADERSTDGYDIIGNEIFYTYLSKSSFSALLQGLKAKGFKEVKAFDDDF